MKIVLLGKNGQVGWELQRSLAPLGELRAFGHEDVDLARLEQLRALLQREQPDVLVNAAAYTAVDAAESEPEQAQRINAEAVQVMAECAAQCDAWLLHYSTDYVFDGEKVGAYVEDDEPRPLSVYGRSKLAGEEAIRRVHARHLILRTCWVYGAQGGNFARTMLRLAAQRDQLRVVNDQFGAPTGAELIADASAHALHRLLHSGAAGSAPPAAGTYHLSAGGVTHWHEYACTLIALAREQGLPVRVADDAIEPVASSEYPMVAHRPRNSQLDSTRFAAAFDLHLPDWRAPLPRFVAELGRQTKNPQA